MRSLSPASALGLFAVLSCSHAPSANDAAAFAPSECEVGVYHKNDAAFVAVTKRGEGFRYTFSDGVLGNTTASDAKVECGDGAVRIKSEEVWPKLATVETDTRFESNGVSLTGRLMEPPGADADTPLVVYAHGSEETGWLDSARDPYQMLGRGVSVFVYDKRGTGLSEGEYTQNFPRLADDLVAASKEAQRLAEGRFGRFGLFGLSQGGWIAPLAVDRAEAEFIGIGYGLVVDIREEDAAQVSKDLRDAGYGEDVVEKARMVTDATARIVTSGYRDGLEDLDEARRLYSEEPWFPLVKGEYTGVLLTMSTDDLRENGVPFFDRLDVDWSLNPMEVLGGVRVPQLWVLAAEDREAPIALTLERLGILRERGSDIAVYVFPDTDHGMWEFDQAADGSRDFTRVTPGFYDLMADWAKGDLDGKYGAAQRE